MWTQQGSLPLGLKRKKDTNSALRNDHCAKLKPKTRLLNVMNLRNVTPNASNRIR